MDSVEQTLDQWSARCSHLIGNHIDLSVPIYDKPGLPPRTLFVLRQLLINCHTTSESALLLIGKVRLWDAEILIRSVLEGTVRFMFLCNSDEGPREQRVQEYWEDLPESENIRTHNRLQHILSQVDNPLADEWRPFRDLLLKEEEIGDLQQKYPKNIRGKMEQQWSFGNIVTVMKLSGLPELDFRAMTFNYGLSSHLIHKDATALKLAWDRVFREDDRRNALELAHGTRMLSDIFTFSSLRTMLFYKVQKEDTKTLKNILENQRPYLEEIEQAFRKWHDIEYRNQSV